MNAAPFPARLLTELRSCGALSTLVLTGKRNVFGTVQLDQDGDGEPRFGEFVAADSNVDLNGWKQAMLLLPAQNLSFSVNVFPGGGSLRKVQFECFAWRYLRTP